MSDSEKPKTWKERKQSVKHKLLVPFIFPEWLCEWISYFLGRWAFLDILGHIGRLTILIAVITYFMGADERRMQAENQQKAKHYQAWQVIYTAYGKPGGGGRKDALEDLARDGISLASVDISNIYIPELNLAGADLRGANLAGSDFREANLSKANLEHANLAGAFLENADLTRADLWEANLSKAYLCNANLAEATFIDANLVGANLMNTDLAGADLGTTDLTGANFHVANLAKADLQHANLTGANFQGVNLAKADLEYANLENITLWRFIKNIKSANIYNVKNPPDGFISWAKEHGAVSIEDYDEWKKFLKEKQQEIEKEK